MTFIAISPSSKKIYKLALMLQNMDVNVYIYGQSGVGKTFLAHFIAENNNEIIVEDIKNDFKFNSSRVIATAYHKPYADLQDKFPIIIELKKLNERKEDIPAFIELFSNQAQRELNIEKEINLDIDISENLHSLKRKVYKQLLCEEYNKNEIIDILKNYFDKNYSENDSYHSMLKIFDKALIETLLDKYKSKLQVANHLKINRHTLTKKVKELEN